MNDEWIKIIGEFFQGIYINLSGYCMIIQFI